MQAVILAAGMGNRLGKYTQNNTKCMLPINGHTLIERALDAINDSEISKCIIVVGYQKENLMRFIGDKYKNIEIIYVANDIYNRTNNIYSLYLAKDYLQDDDTLLLESDLIFEPRLIREMLEYPEPTIAAVAPYESWMDGTVVQISRDNIITNFIPRKFFDYTEKSSYYKTVNIYKFSKDFLKTSYLPFLEAYSQAMGTNEYYEQVLRVITTLDKNELKAFVLNGQKWYEIDDIQDKDIAEILFSNSAEEKLQRIQSRYGGYWRFPSLLDFCYLVNPYFPTEQMQNEMKAYFSELMAEYPSGLNVQNLLAGKLFSVDAENILVGNGAAELIRAVAGVLEGSVGVIYPTFNEYPESFVNNTIVPFFPEDISYGINQLSEWSSQCDNLLLVNPDNPSGNFIPRNDVIKLLEILKKGNKRLILDESFIDFCDAGENVSLMHQDLLERFPNLILIKSISKSYGVPGLRLGVLACGDLDTIKKIRSGISIWNINSFAEWFLQIIGKYVKDYRHGCKLLVEERERFSKQLEATGLFKVYPSQANYFLCRCMGNFSAKDITLYLLDSHDIFIKDLTGKKGISDDRWLRLAVRDYADNNKLIETLNQFISHSSLHPKKNPSV
jgi:histidinol-phosphate/aromatic aminotransferase/cobyric acid decarboxylase-like protein/choline kinase